MSVIEVIFCFSIYMVQIIHSGAHIASARKAIIVIIENLLLTFYRIYGKDKLFPSKVAA